MNLSTFILEEGSVYGSERPAITAGDGTWTYADLAGRMQTIVRALHSAGVRSGDRVVAVLGNTPDYFAAYLACAHLGSIFATVNLDFREGEIKFIMEHSAPRCIVLDEVGASRLTDAGIQAAVPVVRLDQLTMRPNAPFLPAVEVDNDTPVLMCYTSGSTARPKPVVTSHGAEIWAARAHRAMWRVNASDVVLNVLPLAWLFGLGTVGLTTLASAARLVLLPRFRPDTAAQAVSSERVTVVFGVTTMFLMLVDYVEGAEADATDLTSLRLAISGGERRNESAFEKFRALTGSPVLDVYSCTESRPVCSYDPLVDSVPKPGSCGRLFPGVEAQLRDAEGAVLPLTEVGELWTRSPAVFLEYYNLPEMTAERRDADGWVRMGDLLRCDGEGYWYVEGRAADFIVRGGANVSPAEVEEVILSMGAVTEVAVVGREHPKFGEEVVAIVVGAFEDDSAASEEVSSHVHKTLAEFKVPTATYLVESLPKGPTGKVDRRGLRAWVASQKGIQQP